MGGLATVLLAVGAVLLAAAASYFLLFPVPLPMPRVVALTSAALGIILMSAGTTGLLSQPRRARRSGPARKGSA